MKFKEFTEQEEAYIEKVQKARENMQRYNVSSHIILAEPTRIWASFFMLVVINLFFVFVFIQSLYGIMAILIVCAVFLFFNSLLIVSLIKDIKEWKFLKQYKRDYADDFTLEIRENGELRMYLVTFYVFTDMIGEIKKTVDVSENTYNMMENLEKLPIYLEIGTNKFDYNIDYKKVKKLQPQEPQIYL